MKRTLIALALSLGTTAALATPTLDLYGDGVQGWKRVEGTIYQSDVRAAAGTNMRDPRDYQPFNP